MNSDRFVLTDKYQNLLKIEDERIFLFKNKIKKDFRPAH